MLSRSASSVYWMNRYLERADRQCSLLVEQFGLIESRPVAEIDRAWRRMYRALGRLPTAGGEIASEGQEHYMLADAFTLADDLTFETQNLDSIRSCIAAARSNALQVRHAVGVEMWISLNFVYHELAKMEIGKVWADAPREFYVGVRNSIRTVSGVATTTTYRDEAWRFMQLGTFVERLQFVASLVEAHLSPDAEAGGPVSDPFRSTDSEVAWDALLSACEARDAFRRLHSLRHDAEKALRFMVADPQLAHSIRYSLERVATHLTAVTSSEGERTAMQSRERIERLAARIDQLRGESAPWTPAVASALMSETREAGRHAHGEIDAKLFRYPVADYQGP